MNFQEFEGKFWEIKGKFLSGVIDENTYKESLKKLKIRDEAGDFWKIDEKTGKWLTFDGDDWVSGTPKSIQPESIQPESESIGTKDSHDEVEKNVDAEDTVDNIESDDIDDDELYMYEEAIDEDFEYGEFNPDELQDEMKELEDVVIDDVNIGRNKGTIDDYFDDSDLDTYLLTKEGNRDYFNGYGEFRKQEQEDEEEPIIGDTSGPAKSFTIMPKITGERPKIPKDAAILTGIGTLATTASKVAKAAKVAKTVKSSKLAKTTESAETAKSAKTTKATKATKATKPTKPTKAVKPAETPETPETPKVAKSEAKITSSSFICEECGNELKETAKFCNKCGNAVKVKSKEQTNKLKFCTDCGNKLKQGAKFCNNCGKQL